jgi:ribosomal protein S12 methylthiotransferase
MDLYGEPRLVELIDELERVEGIEWIRLMYLYPMYFSERLIEKIAESGKILPYLDLPLQHISDRVLRRMQRRVNRRETEELLAALRARIANLVLRTTLIAGFPGESEEEFEELVEFVRHERFERLGVFSYSLEPDTPAARLDGHLSEEIKLARRDRLMAEQQRIAFEWNRAQIGRRFDVLVDSPVDGEKNAWIGRSYADAPDVDGAVYVSGPKLARGRMVNCEIVATSDYDLVGVAVGKSR